MTDQEYSLVRVESEDQWHAYHEIRRQVLYEDRGHFGKYNPNHPDDRDANNHPVLLVLDGEPIGAMRVDFVPECDYAIMRTVAIRKEHQRHGHGTALLSMAEDHARVCGRALAVTVSGNWAVPFYEKCGYEPYEWDASQMSEHGTQMRRLLTNT